VLINSRLKGNWIQAHAYIPFPEQAEGNSALTSALEALAAQFDVAGCVCIVSFPADQVYFRNIQVPFKHAKKIRQILPFELEPTMPLPVERLIIDYHKIDVENAAENTELIAAAVDTSRLESYLELLSEFDIDPEIVTVGGYPAAVCLALQTDIPENTLLVDVTNDKGTLFGLSSGQLVLVRSVPSGSVAASRLKMLCQNIERTLYALEEASNYGFKPDKIFLTGPVSAGNGFEAEMAQQLEIPTQQTDLINDAAVRISNRPTESWKADQMDNALALALMEVSGAKGLNFRKGPFAITKRWVEHKKRIIRSGVLAAVVLLLLLTSITIDYYSQKNRLNALNTQIKEIFQSTFPDVKKVVDPLHQMREKIKAVQRASLFPAGAQNNTLMVGVLNEISQRIPGGIDVQFTRMVIGDDSVVIAGDTDTFNSVDTMKNRLETAKIFETVTIVSTNKDKSGNRIRFRLKLKI
jgi:type II secretion system protein L